MTEQADLLLIEIEDKMEKSVEAIVREFQTIRTGRANPSLLNNIFIDYYGVETPVKQIATITVPEGNQLYIKPYDRSSLKQIEYALGTSNLGLTPQNDGIGIRLILPMLTEERRKALCKDVEKIVENGKVAVRNIRREGNDQVKKLDLSEDFEYEYQQAVQKLTDEYTVKMDEAGKVKIEEIMVI